MIIVLIGPPGAGKGTQSDLMVREWNFCKITVGDLLRQEVTNKTEFGEQINSFLSKGHLVPDLIICNLVLSEIKKNSEKNIILDGTPRTLFQAKFLDKELLALNKVINAAIELKIEENALINRLSNRYICGNCKASFNKKIHFDLNKACVYCGSMEYITRNDDNEIIVRERMAVYKKENLAILQYYKENNKLFTIDANEEIAKVESNLKIIINSLQKA